ncbi:MAG: PAS domain S-box protein [Spirochaetes bacterium]|nr:PAS domain S-box protein [Spirochaetota bacterium]
MDELTTLNYHALFNNAQVMLHFTDVNIRIVAVNEFWLEKMGYAEDEVINRKASDFMAEDSREKVTINIPELIKNKKINGIEGKAVTKSGELIDIIFGIQIVFGEEGQLKGFLTTTIDVTMQKKAEEALRQRELYLTAIIENQPGLVWLKDAESRFLAVNRAFAHSCGKTSPSELVGKTDIDIWPVELAEKYRADDMELIKNNAPIKIEELISDAGTRRWFETYKAPVENAEGEIIGTTGYAHDITDRKLKDEALHNMQKLESLGVLAGGIAHDFNNLLSGIFNNIDIALMLTKENDVRDVLLNAKKVIYRSRGLTRQLLTFAKGGTPIKKIENLVTFITETVQFALSGANTIPEFAIPDDLWLCEIDKGQIGQVIDNIIINAHQAMPNGGTISISAENFFVDKKAKSASLDPGRYVKIKISDQGDGIPPDVLPQIFDPFFTTKPSGNGLGLATSHSIVKRHGGGIEVETELGMGSTFTIYLPAASDSISVTDEKKQSAVRSKGIVIIMDDVDVVLSTSKRLLELIGYDVITTENGPDAVTALKKEINDNRSVSAMLLDLTVPGGVGGLDVISQIRAIDKNLPVFVVSGYADDPIMSDPEKYGFTGSICKPFTLKELTEIL